MEGLTRLLLTVLLHLAFFIPARPGNRKLWSTWWSYQGISGGKMRTALMNQSQLVLGHKSIADKGPDYWGMVNTQWGLCSKGRYQSPVDLNPRALLHDPNLRPLRLDQHRVDGLLINTGNDITFQIDPGFEPPFTLAGGPLSYTYRVHYIKLHFGRVDQTGSEHTVAGRPFPMEIQLLAYNTMYDGYNTAANSAHGLAALAVFGAIREDTNEEFHTLVYATSQIPHAGTNLSITGLSISSILPETLHYMTYEGSMTQPACYETVTWIILNKPFYISKADLSRLRELTESKEGGQGVQYLQENNFRPTMALNRRTVRTNIAPKPQGLHCKKKKITIFEGVQNAKTSTKADMTAAWLTPPRACLGARNRTQRTVIDTSETTVTQGTVTVHGLLVK